MTFHRSIRAFGGLATVLFLAGAWLLPPGLAEEKAGKGGGVVMFGDGPGRNLVNVTDKGAPDDFGIDLVRNKKVLNTKRRLLWTAKLGTKAYGGPIIAGGRIFVGTNNGQPRDPKKDDDLGVLMCFEAKTGKFLWQHTHEKLPGGERTDHPKEGIASVPAVEAGRVYYLSNRCEVICAEVEKGKVLWAHDLIKNYDVFPCQLATSSPLILGDTLYIMTGHGVDIGTGEVPNKKAPSLVALDKKDGKLKWKFTVPGEIIRGQWSSVAAATIDGKTQIIMAAGDSYVYGLSADKGEVLWKFNYNPSSFKEPYKPGGAGEQCFVIGVPVIVDGKCYVAIGQEPEDGQGKGGLWCIDITKKPTNKEKDLSAVDEKDPASPKNKGSGLVWFYGGEANPARAGGIEYRFGRTPTTVAVHDGLVYASELAGFLHCLDAKTGKHYWEHDLDDSTWCSPYYVDGKVYIGSDNGTVIVFKAGKTEPTAKTVKKSRFGESIKVPPVFVDGILYVNTGKYLHAFK